MKKNDEGKSEGEERGTTNDRPQTFASGEGELPISAGGTRLGWSILNALHTAVISGRDLKRRQEGKSARQSGTSSKPKEETI